MSATAPKSGKAIASLILGIWSICCAIVLSIPAIIVGVLALIDIHRSRGRLGGKGMALAGIVVGSFTTTLVPCIVAPLLWPAIQAGRDAAQGARCRINLREIGVALHRYEASHGSLPPTTVWDGQGRAVHSWRALMAPFFEDGPLVEAYDFNEPWDGPRNRLLTDPIPPVFRCEADSDGAGAVGYVVVVGPEFIFRGNELTTLDEIAAADGLANTIMAVELADSGIPWSEPGDLTWDEFAALYANHGVSKHRGGFFALLGDATVEFVPYDMPLEDLYALFTFDGGEPVAAPQLTDTPWVGSGR